MFKITYRSNFPKINNLTTDSRWGCTIRSSQMLLINLLYKKYNIPMLNLLHMFLDYNTSIFSIHNIVEIGTLHYNMREGVWYAPGTCMSILSDLLKENTPKFDQNNDQNIEQDDKNKSINLEIIHDNGSKRIILDFLNPFVLSIPIRLGLKNINEIYIPSLIKLINLKYCIGLLGGYPGKCFYIFSENLLGFGIESRNNLLYIDPHEINECVKDPLHLTIEEILTYTNTEIKILKESNIKSLDPSMTICFYISNEEEYKDLLSLIKELNINIPFQCSLCLN